MYPAQTITNPDYADDIALLANKPAQDETLLHSVMVQAMVCEIVTREFELQSRYNIHFRTNTLGKGMNPLILPDMG